MILGISFLLLAGALLVGMPASPLGAGTKHPRDGPRPERGEGAGGNGKIRGKRRLFQGASGGTKAQMSPLQMAYQVELFAACLEAGLGQAQGAAAVASIAVGETAAWKQTASLLALGIPAARAWEPIAQIGGLEELVTLTTLSEQSGAAIATGAVRLAEKLRSSCADAATARAERAGVLIALPLALCYLPAFIVLGLVPIVISLGTQILSN